MTPTQVHMLRESVARAPAATALVCGERQMSYGALWSETCAVAAFLRDRGLACGARVGILLENSPQYVAAYYGILAAGGVAVSLNTAAKARDLWNWLQHADATWLFASAKHRELAALVTEHGAGIGLVTVGQGPPGKALPEVDAEWPEVLAADGSPPDIDALAADPDRLAALIYTSGTTGNPKGVSLSHRNLAANTRSILSYLQLDDRDSVVNVLPFFYSYGNSVLHTHLAAGGRLVLENSMVYPHRVLARIAEQRVTGFSGVPSTFALLLSRTRLEDFDLSALRYLTQAGGPMPSANIERLRRALPHVRIFIMYGQTEATARLTYLPPEMLEEKLGSCGVPIPQVEIEVRDADGRRVPPGVVGEIYARGDNVMQGYWKNPQATGAVLVDGWLKTGDHARVDEEGYLFIVGRSSEMIKSGGQRISPQEIEEVIAELSGVAEVGVVGIEDEILGEVIKAVVVLAPAAQLKPLEIKNHCLRHLASYKIPKIIEFVPDLPKTSSGKLRRHLLKEIGRPSDGIRQDST